MAAPTTEIELDGSLELGGISEDWDYKASKPSGWPDNPRLNSIEFHPGAANDRLVVKQKEDGGPTRFDSNITDSAADSRIKYFHGSRVLPYIDYSECIFGAGHKVIIELWREA
jgi:hypothetical protein